MTDPDLVPATLHVLHVIDGLGLGGAERMLVDIANATVADGNRVSVCITRNVTTLVGELDSRVAVMVIDRRRRLSLSPALRLARWARSQRVDIVHVHMRSSLKFVLLLRALRVLRLPIVFHDHYGTIELDTSVPLWFRVGHRYIDHYVGVYDKLRDWAQRSGMPSAKTSTIPNAIDLSRLTKSTNVGLRAQLGLDPATAIGVLVATLRPDKGIELLIDAVVSSRHRGRVRIVIVGGVGDTAYVADLHTRVRAKQLDDTIIFIGPRSDVPSILAEADFGLVSSLTESGPLVLIEYLAAGLPIVSTLVGDIGRRLHVQRVPGFTPPGESLAFVRALDELLDLSNEERRARGLLGQRVLTENWDIRAAMPAWYAAYHAASD